VKIRTRGLYIASFVKMSKGRPHVPVRVNQMTCSAYALLRVKNALQYAHSATFEPLLTAPFAVDEVDV
jgi:hypothetical protein